MKQIIRTGVLAASLIVAVNATAATLETEAQKLGYVFGMEIGNQLKQGGAEVDVDALVEALRAAYTGQELALTPEQATTIRNDYIAARRAEAEAAQKNLAAANAAAGDKFLLENAKREGVQVTESGLQYEVLEMGEGAKPSASDTVTVHYRGTLLDGTEFDSSYARNQEATFGLGQVIPGWTEGLQLMPVGSKFKFYIPSGLAYGANGPPSIGPNATLIFEVELLGIQ
ncbi:MAG: FKBP-type peptidyl-prolyl cis-trans isomerase [Xanthomonadales bacterium]|jgi:FKBP-type peptidyl-prolyl cis-trans isomerase FkpA/FKBP-type peptidyl-prolyl cis-trans isomerase FklB